MLRESMLPLSLCLLSAAARASGFAHFDTLAEGQNALTIVDGGITFSNLDILTTGIPNFAPEQADGTLTGMSGFTPLMTLGFGNYSPGPNAQFGRVKSFEMSTGSLEGFCTLELFDLMGVGNTVTLEAYLGGSVVASTSLPLAPSSGVHHYTLSVGGESFDHLRLVSSGPNNQGTMFILIDEVRIDRSFPTFCTGDGHDPLVTTACPCGNIGGLGQGCMNSLFVGGARLFAGGTTIPDTLVLMVTGEPPAARRSIFLQGTATIDAGTTFGDGVRCVSGTLTRIVVRGAAGGNASYPDPGDPSISAQSAAHGDPISPGSTRYYQVYYREPAALFCPPPAGGAFNISNGVRVTW